MFEASIGYTLSAEYPISTGISQRLALSPLLYAIFTADIPKPPRTRLAIYADDSPILIRSISAHNVTTYLQEAIAALEE